MAVQRSSVKKSTVRSASVVLAARPSPKKIKPPTATQAARNAIREANAKRKQGHQKMKKILEDIRAKAPRWLFRGWSSASGGGEPGLNSEHEIVPRAFVKNPMKKATPLHLKPNITRLIRQHITWASEETVETEFSSWSACIDQAMRYINVKRNHPGDVWISIVDTKLLQPQRGFYWVSALQDAKLAACASPKYWEWLAYGPIRGKGRGFWSVKMDRLLSPGLEYGFTKLQHGHLNWTRTALNEPISKAVEKGVAFAKLFLQDEICQANVPTLFVLVITWLVMQSLSEVPIRNTTAGSAIIWAVYYQTGFMMPDDLDPSFVETFFPQQEANYERSRDLVHALSKAQSEMRKWHGQGDVLQGAINEFKDQRLTVWAVPGERPT